MIIAIVKAKIMPEKHDALRAIANILQYDYAPTEHGCESYESFIDGDVFITIERWTNQESLDVHLNADHVAKYVPELRKCVKDGMFNVQFIQANEISFVKI